MDTQADSNSLKDGGVIPDRRQGGNEGTELVVSTRMCGDKQLSAEGHEDGGGEAGGLGRSLLGQPRNLDLTPRGWGFRQKRGKVRCALGTETLVVE